MQLQIAMATVIASTDSASVFRVSMAQTVAVVSSSVKCFRFLMVGCVYDIK